MDKHNLNNVENINKKILELIKAVIKHLEEYLM